MKLILCCILLALGAPRASAQSKPARATAPATARAKPLDKDFTRYIRGHPGNWMVARSVKPALSEGEALDDARRQAASSLVPTVLSTYGTPLGTSRPWLESQLVDSMLAGNWIADQQVSVDERPYGKIYSASLLINRTPKNYNALVADIQRRAAHLASATARRTGSCIIWILVIACLFLIANASTRGFLRFRLAFISILLIGAGLYLIPRLV